ncbi:MAG TPA: cell envelope integrity protein CreD [Cyclobacteriaceae bacterium]|nr:cell envelope integrity protein CreD [Cyclobacteriaceae bacterium]
MENLEQPTWIERLNDSLSRSVTVKLISVTFLVLLLLIPQSMITSLIREREGNMQDVMTDISGKWSGSQQVAGPVLVIPYHYNVVSDNGKVTRFKKYAFFLPDTLEIESRVTPEKRYRGIYSIIVYKSEISLSGVYPRPDFASMGIAEQDVLWSEAAVQIGISDLRGIVDNVQIDWDSRKYGFSPGNTNKELIPSGISANIAGLAGGHSGGRFSIHLALKGSENLWFLPFGKETQARVSSTWNTPSFTGAFLPDQREVNNDGFNATWKILHFNRNYPQQWADQVQSWSDSAFGINFLIPADHYLKSLRSSKYSILVIALTFLVFFLIEIINNQKIHPVQYVLVGMALTLFYVMLLSISEHIGFNPAYIIASVLVISMIFLYSRTIVDNNRVALLMLLFLIVNYGFIYIIIQLESYSLLVGSIGLFVALAVTMYVSRKVKWYGRKE